VQGKDQRARMEIIRIGFARLGGMKAAPEFLHLTSSPTKGILV
jgi:hypothetical protein